MAYRVAIEFEVQKNHPRGMIINTLNGADGRADLRQAESLELVRCPIYKNKKLPFGSFIL